MGGSNLCLQPQAVVCLVPGALGNTPGGSIWLGGRDGSCLTGAGGGAGMPQLWWCWWCWWSGSQASRTQPVGPALCTLLSLLVTVGSRQAGVAYSSPSQPEPGPPSASGGGRKSHAKLARRAPLVLPPTEDADVRSRWERGGSSGSLTQRRGLPRGEAAGKPVQKASLPPCV